MDHRLSKRAGSMWRRSWIGSQGLFWYLAGIGMVWDWFQTPASGQDSQPVKAFKDRDRTERRSTALGVARKPHRALSSSPKSEAAKRARGVSALSSGLGLLLAEKKSGGVDGSVTQADPGDGGRKVVVLHNTVGVTNNILVAVKTASSSSAVPSARRAARTSSYATVERQSHGPAENILMPLQSNPDLVVEQQPSSVKSIDRFSMTDSGTNTPVSRSSVISIESSLTTESSASSAAHLVKEEELFESTGLQKERFASMKEVEEHESCSLLKGVAIEWGGKSLNESFSLVKDVEEHESHGGLRKGAEIEWGGDCLEVSETLDITGCCRTPSEDASYTAQLLEGLTDSNITGGNCSVSALGGASEDGDARCSGDLCVDGDGRHPREAVSVVEEDEGKSAVKVGESCAESSASYTAQLHEGPTGGNITGGNYSVCALSDASEDGDARCAGEVCVDGDGRRPGEVASVVNEDEGKSAVTVGESCGESSASYMVGKEGSDCDFPDNGRCTNGSCMDGGDASLRERVGVVKADDGKSNCKVGEVCAERSFGDMMMVTEEDVCGLDATGCPDDGRSEDDQGVEGTKGDDDDKSAKIYGFCECTDTRSAAGVREDSAVFGALGVTALQEEHSSRASDDDLCMEGEEDGDELGVCEYSVNQTGTESREEISHLVRESGLGHRPRSEGGQFLDCPDGLMIADDDGQCQVAGKTGSEDLTGKPEDCVVDDNVQGVGHVQLIRHGSAIKSTVGDPCIDSGHDEAGDDGMKEEVDCSLKNILRLEALTGSVEKTDEGTGGGTEEVKDCRWGVEGAEEGVVGQGQLLGASENTSIVRALMDLHCHSNLPKGVEQTLPGELSAVEQSMEGADGKQPTDVPCLESDREGGCSECDSPNKTLCNFQEDATGGLHDVVVENAARTLSIPAPVTTSSIGLPRSLGAVSLAGDTSQVAGGESLPAFLLPCDECQVVEKPAELAGREQYSMPSCGDNVGRLVFHASGGEVRCQGRTRSLQPANFAQVKDDALSLASLPPIQSAPLSMPASHPTAAQPPFSVPASLSAMSFPSAGLLERSVPSVSLAQMTSQTSILVPVTDSNEVWSNVSIDEEDNHPQSFAATAQLGEPQLLLRHWSSIATAKSGQSQSSLPDWSSMPCSGQSETVATGTVSAVENLAHRERVGAPTEVARFGVSGEPETAGFSPPGPLTAKAEAGFEWHGDECCNPVEKPCVSYSQVMDPERNTRPDACCTRRTDWERAVYVAMCREYTENLFRQLVSQHLQQYSTSVSTARLLRNYSNCEGSIGCDKAGSLEANRSGAAQMARAYDSPQMEFAATEPEVVQKQGVMLGPPEGSVGRGLLPSELCQPLPRNEPVLELIARQSAGRGESHFLPEVANIQGVAGESRAVSSSAFEHADRMDELRSVKRDGGGGGQVSPNPLSMQGKESAALQDPGSIRQIGTGAGQHHVLDVGSSSTRAGDIEERVMSANKGLLRRLQHPDVGKRMIVKNLGVLMVMLVTVVLYTRMICKGAVAWAKDHPRRNGQQCKEQARPEESV